MMILASPDQKRALRCDIDRLVKQSRPKIVKNKVKRITNIDKIIHKSITKGTNKYFTTGHKCEERIFGLEGSPYSQDFKKIEKPVLKRYMKPTLNWESRHGICERLRVVSPDIQEGVTDVIPDFYKISCRPVKENFSKRKFVKHIRTSFINNLESGLFLDIIKRIEMHDDISRSILQKSVDDSEEAVWSLRVFLSEQIKDIRSIEDELKIVTNLRIKKEKNVETAMRKLGNTKVEMFKIMEKINSNIKCRDFLHSCSSKQWLYEYNIKKTKYCIKNKNKVDELMNMYNKYVEHLGGKDPGLEEIMLNYIKLFENTGPRLIQFKTTNDLGSSLKKLEKDNKSSLMHIKEIEEPVKKVRSYLKQVKKSKNDVDFIKNEILKTQNDLYDIKSRIDMKKIIFNDMIKRYKKSIVSKEILYERGLIKSLYDEIVIDKKMNPSILEMWEGIEQSFMHIRSKLAEIPSKEVERRKVFIIKSILSEEQVAVRAKNRIKQVEQMVEGIRRAYEKPAKIQIGKALMPRSEPPPPPLRTPTPPSPNKTKEYAKILKEEHKMYSPLAIKYPRPNTPKSIISSQLSLISEKIKRSDVYDMESLIPKHKKHGLKDEYYFDPDDYQFKGLAVEEPLELVLKLPQPPKVVMPKYVPKIEEIKKTSEDEDSDFDKKNKDLQFDHTYAKKFSEEKIDNHLDIYDKKRSKKKIDNVLDIGDDEAAVDVSTLTFIMGNSSSDTFNEDPLAINLGNLPLTGELQIRPLDTSNKDPIDDVPVRLSSTRKLQAIPPEIFLKEFTSSIRKFQSLALNTPYDYFRHICTDKLLDLLVKKSNNYCIKAENWETLSKNELLVAIGLYLHTGTIKMQYIAEYWSKNDYFDGLVQTCFPRIMKKDRFMNIMKSLFYCDEAGSFLDKVQPVLDFYNKRIDEIYPSTKFFENESGLLITGCLDYRKFPNTRYKYIQLNMLVESKGIPIKYFISHKSTIENINEPYETNLKETPALKWSTKKVGVMGKFHADLNMNSFEDVKFYYKESNVNQLFSNYPVDIPVNCHQKIGLHVFHIMLMSSYYFYNMNSKRGSMDFHEFRLSLVRTLITLQPPNSSPEKLNHFPIKNLTVLWCRRCDTNNSRILTKYYCSGCSGPQLVGLCIECFQCYHESE